MVVTVIVIDIMQDRHGAMTMKNKAIIGAMQDHQGATIDTTPMFQASMETKRFPMATMAKSNKAIIVKLNMVATIMTI